MDSKRIVAISIGLIFLAVALVPVVSATHLSSMYTRTPLGPADLASGYVFEDDEEVANAPGTNLDGLVNRVSKNVNDEVGDGSMMLDSQFFYGPNPGVNSAYYLNAAGLGRTLIPGHGYFIGFFGWWNDFNGDQIIDLYLDAEENPDDEFKWRGVATGESLNMVLFTVPRFNSMGVLADSSFVRTSPGAWRDAEAQNASAAYADRTALTEAQQKWVVGSGWGTTFVDEGLLMTFQTITVADAEATSGGQLVNIHNATALIDVDKYQAFSAETENLYVTTMRDVLATYNFVTDPVFAIADPILNPIIDDVNVLIDSVIEETNDVTNLVAPQYLKEPNTIDDVYGGRATFGGVGDFHGTGNDYTSYQSGFGFWLDAWGETQIGLITNFQTPPGVPQTPGVYGYTWAGTEPIPSGQDDSTKERGSGVLFSIGAAVLMWHDVNKDGWIGAWCDTENPDEWNAEEGRCEQDPAVEIYGDQPNGYWLEPPHGWNDEMVPACGGSSHKTSTIRVEPVGGSWPAGTVVMTDYDKPTGQLWTALDNGFRPWYTPTGTDAVELKWDDQCDASDSYTRAVDQIFFPGGNIGVTLKTTAFASIPEFKDAVAEIDVGYQEVTDVDYYYATL